MFFALSKILGFFAVPSNLLFLIAAAGVVLMFTRFARAGRWLAVIGVVLIGIAGLSPFGNALILPLEQRFPAVGRLARRARWHRGSGRRDRPGDVGCARRSFAQ